MIRLQVTDGRATREFGRPTLPGRGIRPGAPRFKLAVAIASFKTLEGIREWSEFRRFINVGYLEGCLGKGVRELILEA
jgi:hypothetical protein